MLCALTSIVIVEKEGGRDERSGLPSATIFWFGVVRAYLRRSRDRAQVLTRLWLDYQFKFVYTQRLWYYTTHKEDDIVLPMKQFSSHQITNNKICFRQTFPESIRVNKYSSFEDLLQIKLAKRTTQLAHDP